jgi:hypothetical protein
LLHLSALVANGYDMSILFSFHVDLFGILLVKSALFCEPSA